MRYVIREKFFRLGEDSTITDEFGRPVIEVDGKVFSIHDTLIMRDLNGNELARIKKQLVALSPTYHVTRNGQELAAIRKKIFSPFVDRYSVDIAGSEELHVTGSIFEHDYTIRRGNQVVATVSKAWLSLTETYGVDIAPGEDDLLILATVLALDLTEDEERKD
ncbi:MAG TPA: LURP-one-related family protein [Ktedonobacteraceae bacterium]